ncbi:hypothetical protein MTR_0199s0030 [Medicago truncatula]|uniref:Uncharacterized protein n=1 Tax=Medicago truncatula TaxID=3880 RepID=A0A072THG8_MEDTR|nr:hypothetical protein MTR_0199s0030 [Medicago truncatula]
MNTNNPFGVGLVVGLGSWSLLLQRSQVYYIPIDSYLLPQKDQQPRRKIQVSSSFQFWRRVTQHLFFDIMLILISVWSPRTMLTLGGVRHFSKKPVRFYKSVIAVCLRPLEQLASRLGEDLGNSAGKATNLSKQLSSPTEQM